MEAGEAHFVFLHADGTVSCLGDNTYHQCGTKTSAWNDIAAIAAGNAFTVGLRTDGTVVACGSDSAGQCQVDDLHNVIDVEAWKNGEKLTTELELPVITAGSITDEFRTRIRDNGV